MIIYQLEVVVVNKDDQALENAIVTAEALDGGGASVAEYDAVREVYFFRELSMGFYKVSARRDGFLPQEKRVQVHPKPTLEMFILFEAGLAYTLSGGARVPYESHPEVLGVALSRRKDVEWPDLETLKKLLKDLELQSPQIDLLDATAAAGDSHAAVEIPGVFVVHRRMDSPFKETSLRGLRATTYIDAAGPIFRQDEKSLTLFTERLIAQFLPEVTRFELEQLLSAAGLRLVEEMTFAPNLFLAEADASTGEEIIDKAEQLFASGRVVYAEPSMYEIAEEDAIAPKDFLWEGCWDRRLARVDKAWEYLRAKVSPDATFGSPEIIIAVVDNGIISDAEGRPLNQDFTGVVSNGECKTYKLFDFINMVPNHVDLGEGKGTNGSTHGTSCAGVALARTDDESGVAGAAPNARLLGLIYPKEDIEKYNMFLWAAGLPVKTKDPRFPERLQSGAQVITCSIGFGKGVILPGTVKNLLDQLTNRGRDGKGSMVIFSAGNDSTSNRIDRPWGAYEKSFGCAASTLTPTDDEVRASYSNFGHIEWCAPSSSRKNKIAHFPPDSYGVWTSCNPGKGTVPSFPQIITELVSISDHPSGTGNVIKVKNVKNLEAGMLILVGKPGARGSETTTVTEAPNARNKSLKVQGIALPHHTGDLIFGGPCNHQDNFGGTSAAAPLSAGVCALVLSANPDLTWIEAREILRNTAEKIDHGNENPKGRWLDRHGKPATSKETAFFSKFYGYGRLDALRAVRAAREYRFTRDLMIRKSSDDTGLDPCLPFGDSPDIWVRRLTQAPDAESRAESHNEPVAHEQAMSGSDHLIYARIRNIGSEPGLDAWVRFYVALTDGKPLRYPEDWEPINGRGNKDSGTWEKGAYYIGEVAITGVRPNSDVTVNLHWPKALIPPAPAVGEPRCRAVAC